MERIICLAIGYVCGLLQSGYLVARQMIRSITLLILFLYFSDKELQRSSPESKCLSDLIFQISRI